MVNGELSTGSLNMQCAYGKIARIIPNGIGINSIGFVKTVDNVV